MKHQAFTLVEIVIVIGVITILTMLTVSAAVALVRRAEVTATENTMKILDAALGEWELEAGRKLSWGDSAVPAGARYDMMNGRPHVFTITELLGVIGKHSQAKTILARLNPDYVYTYDESEIPAWLMPNLTCDHDPFIQDGGNPADQLGLAHGGITVLDSWGNPIRVVHPGRAADKTPWVSNVPGLFKGFGDWGSFQTPAEAVFHPIDNPGGVINVDGTIYVNDRTLHGAAFYAIEEIYGICQGRRARFVSAGPDEKFGDLTTKYLPPAQQDNEQLSHAADNVYSYPVATFIVEDE